MMRHLFRREDEDPGEYQALVDKWAAIHDAELAADRADPAKNNASSPSGASAGNSATDELFAIKSRIDVEGMARFIDQVAFEEDDSGCWKTLTHTRTKARAKAQALRTYILGEEVEEQSVSRANLPSVVASDARTETPSPAGKPRPPNCANVMRCDWHRLQTEPPTDHWVCGEMGCPGGIVVLTASSPAGKGEL